MIVCRASLAWNAACSLRPGSPPAAGAAQTLLTTQREALRGLGVHGGRPPLTLAASDPEAYVRQLSQATGDAELIDTQGLGGFGWLVQTVGMGLPGPLARQAR